jgi:hypothetical protein
VGRALGPRRPLRPPPLRRPSVEHLRSGQHRVGAYSRCSSCNDSALFLTQHSVIAGAGEMRSGAAPLLVRLFLTIRLGKDTAGRTLFLDACLQTGVPGAPGACLDAGCRFFGSFRATTNESRKRPGAENRETDMYRTKTARKGWLRIHRARSKAKLVLLISALAYLTGCASVVSLHPLALPHSKGVVFHPALLGTWEEAETTADVAKNRYTVACWMSIVQATGSSFRFTSSSGSAWKTTRHGWLQWTATGFRTRSKLAANCGMNSLTKAITGLC